MISSVLALLLATTVQSDEATRQARTAYTGCLRQFMERSLEDRKEIEAFNSEVAGQCTAQAGSLREAIIARELAARGTRARAEEDARLDVEDAQETFKQLFADARTPR